MKKLLRQALLKIGYANDLIDVSKTVRTHHRWFVWHFSSSLSLTLVVNNHYSTETNCTSRPLYEENIATSRSVIIYYNPPIPNYTFWHSCRESTFLHAINERNKRDWRTSQHVVQLQNQPQTTKLNVCYNIDYSEKWNRDNTFFYIFTVI